MGARERAPESGWRQVGAGLERYVLNGFLTEADAYEVEETLALLLERLQRGEISERFVNVVMRKLAEDKVAAWRARYGGVGL
jgi:hypothetical protein